MPGIEADFGAGTIPTYPLLRKSDGTYQNVEVYHKNSDGSYTKLWPLGGVALIPDLSYLATEPGLTLSQDFTVSGATSGTWSISNATVFSLSSQSGTGCTVVANQSSGTHAATLTYTAADGSKANAHIEWTWGVTG